MENDLNKGKWKLLRVNRESIVCIWSRIINIVCYKVCWFDQNTINNFFKKLELIKQRIIIIEAFHNTPRSQIILVWYHTENIFEKKKWIHDLRKYLINSSRVLEEIFFVSLCFPVKLFPACLHLRFLELETATVCWVPSAFPKLSYILQ